MLIPARITCSREDPAGVCYWEGWTAKRQTSTAPWSGPAGALENLTVLQRKFKDVGLNDVDFVALSGVSRRTAASAGEQNTMGGEQEDANKLNANTVGFGAA